MADDDSHRATKHDPVDSSQSFDDTTPTPSSPSVESQDHPERIGRYRIRMTLGKGAFGLVYLADDEQLHRSVAIKVPHARFVSERQDAELYLTEARTVAKLDHPYIVPVYDIGSTDELPCYIVSKYVDGIDLATRLKQSRFNHANAAELVGIVAEALHYAHKEGLVHRDVKPANILIANDEKPHVVDFGLALREENFGQGPKYAGTAAYMSPEQARGEGHRVDGRSDVYSLGAVFYELLVGRRTFTADRRDDLLELIATKEVKPPRQIDDCVPKELERICLKALGKRASERYTTAQDMAEDLQCFLQQHTATDTASTVTDSATTKDLDATHIGSGSDTDGRSIVSASKVVPKGLRSFDEHDADFFLQLLPGPRDRAGLPDSVRFWKTRIDETDPDKTFSVGVIYGPSGCGKSSLIKAGLLPRLSDDVLVVYIEATPQDTEHQLLRGLRKRCPALQDKLNLTETLASLRRGDGIPAGKKVLIILDQFEQWLHTKHEEVASELVQALRQCDGGRVQCILTVRDDFWLALSRFGSQLEIDFVPGNNIALTDLFDIEHARQVLIAFGQAFQKLPPSDAERNREQEDFLKQSVAGLAEDGKVVCVRLALFAEMVKGKPWTPTTLRKVGGTQGIGVSFLEDTFCSPSAVPRHRLHEKAARAVLKALLPRAGANIRGEMKAYNELLEASGYSHRPKDFDELIRILDGEIRLITPTDVGSAGNENAVTQAQAGQKYFQLTHDYLVPALREWLSRKQKETRRGRSELRLTEKSAAWNADPKKHHLPSLWEFGNICLFTRPAQWTPPQAKMLKRAAAIHAARLGVVLMALALAGGVYWQTLDGQIAAIVTRLQNSSGTGTRAIIKELDQYPDRMVKAKLRKSFATEDELQQLPLAFALAEYGDLRSDYLLSQIKLDQVLARDVENLILALNTSPREALVDIRSSAEEASRLRNWGSMTRLATLAMFLGDGSLAAEMLHDERGQTHQVKSARQSERDRRTTFIAEFSKWGGTRNIALHATRSRPFDIGVALAFKELLAVSDTLEREFKQATKTADDLTTQRSEVQSERIDLSALAESERQTADAAATDAREESLAELEEQLSQLDEQLTTALEKARETDRSLEQLGSHLADLALQQLDAERADNVWPLLAHRSDQRRRSYFVHRIANASPDVGLIIDEIKRRSGSKNEQSKSIRRALLICLGQFLENPEAARDLNARMGELEALVTDSFRNDPDPGIHGAARWVMLKMGFGSRLRQIEAELRGKPRGDSRWFIDSNGHTMIVFPAEDRLYMMGSPISEDGRERGVNPVADNSFERRHLRSIEWGFAISAMEVTVEQFVRFQPDHVYAKDVSPEMDCPINYVTWYDAARYCNWLSEQEGIPKDQHCYIFEERRSLFSKDPVFVVRFPADYVARKGYRLPTESEWEYVCRADSATRWHFGESDVLLQHHAWYTRNSGDMQTHTVGAFLPNDWGLFDMYGNVAEWCHGLMVGFQLRNAQMARPDGLVHEMARLVVSEEHLRVLRGGAFNSPASRTRSAARESSLPSYSYYGYGFRVVRSGISATDVQ